MGIKRAIKTIYELIHKMPISKKLNEAFNNQIKEELESAYVYLSMSVWLDEHCYTNLADWYHHQAIEEYEHAEKFMKFILEAGGTVELKDIKKPKSDWKSVEEIVETGLEHEKYITGKIHELVKLADEDKDPLPRSLLQWFVDEQVEEEASADELLTKLRAFKNDMLFDQHVRREED
jgi:ferritin